MKNLNTQERILSAAESLIQKRGYNAFSYKDIAAEVGIKTSSIHYYYPAKEDLAVAVIDWQINRIASVLDDIKGQAHLSTKDKLLMLIESIVSLTYADEMKMCLGGMFASELLSLPESVQIKARHFFKTLTQWIEEVLTEGKQLGSMKLLYPMDKFPLYLVLQIEGALLMSRLYGDRGPINSVKQFIEDVVD
ncbi:MAG: TetR/AcrR family transcriptional regulator [Legionella sp.]|jgi:TetR/AcrR family transcriptional repressor of nem operon